MRFRKVYGKSKDNNCFFCGKTALTENSQGLPACSSCRDKKADDKRCACGEYLDIKKSKWGAFFLCHNCGPISLSKVNNMGAGGCKLNKRFRDDSKKLEYDKDKVYTIEELEKMWE